MMPTERAVEKLPDLLRDGLKLVLSAPLLDSDQPTLAIITPIPAIAFGARSLRSGSRHADINHMNFRACWTFASASPTCARPAREWTIRLSISRSTFRASVKRYYVIGQRRSPLPARKRRVCSMDGPQQQLRWAGNREIKILCRIFPMSSCWPRLPAPRRAAGRCGRGRRWPIG